MKRLFCLLMLCCMLVSFDKSAPKVLIFVKEGSTQLEYMLTNEVAKMQDIIRQSGFDSKVATISGEVLNGGSIILKPDLKLSEVNIDDYEGFLLPCMTLDIATPEMISFVQAAVGKDKPVAAQAGSVVIFAKAGILNGRKYALNIDNSIDPSFQGATYGGYGVIQDGKIITSGVCPWIAKETGKPDGTVKITQTLLDEIKADSK